MYIYYSVFIFHTVCGEDPRSKNLKCLLISSLIIGNITKYMMFDGQNNML